MGPAKAHKPENQLLSNAKENTKAMQCYLSLNEQHSVVDYLNTVTDTESH